MQTMNLAVTQFRGSSDKEKNDVFIWSLASNKGIKKTVNWR